MLKTTAIILLCLILVPGTLLGIFVHPLFFLLLLALIFVPVLLLRPVVEADTRRQQRRQ